MGDRGSPIVEGVVFDLDGTLYTLSGLRPRMALSLWRSLGVLRHISGARRAVRQREFADGDALRGEFYRELGDRAGISQARAAEWYQEMFLPAFVALLDRHGTKRPELLKLLARLRTRGVRLAVVSDFPRVEDRLRALGIPPEAFDAVGSAEESGALKPWPRALLSVAAQWEMEPTKVLVVGDRQDLDGACAEAAGMAFLGVDNGVHRGGRGKGFVSWRAAAGTIATRTGIGVDE